jgi:predicted MFS family arabinose efflux permease
MSAGLGSRAALLIFASFAFAYFFSALLRAVTATLAPVFSAELDLAASDLGLLAGAYFLGFSAMQLPLGSALDRWGSKRVLLVLLSIGVLGCVGFALAQSFTGLMLTRVLIGVGVSACLMAPLTAFRQRFSPAAQMRANSWMLMTGSLGMLASTLPVQWLLPSLGWRGLFWLLAALLLLAMVCLQLLIPRDAPMAASETKTGSYRQVFRDPLFVRMLPLALLPYGGMVAVQSLWAGPWLTRVCGWSQAEAAQGLFFLNLAMLLTFLAWGLLMPRLAAHGWGALRLLKGLLPVGLACLLLAVGLGERSGVWAWALFCMGTSVVTLSQPAVGQAFDARLAGRALSAFNLVIFVGVFAVQWGIGLAVDALLANGWSTPAAFQGAFAVLAAGFALAYLWFVMPGAIWARAGR